MPGVVVTSRVPEAFQEGVLGYTQPFTKVPAWTPSRSTRIVPSVTSLDQMQSCAVEGVEVVPSTAAETELLP